MLFIDIIKTGIKMNNLLTISLFQDSSAYDAGYNIGYLVGRIAPFIFIAIIAFFIIRYFKKNQKK